jgi:TPP-dependent indolepyruvate ferredoxin oxidoreductase alpha subunit
VDSDDTGRVERGCVPAYHRRHASTSSKHGTLTPCRSTKWIRTAAPTRTLEQQIQETRLPRAREYGVLNKLNSVTVGVPDAWLGIVAGGHTYLDVIEALRLLGLSEQDATGLGVRILKVRMPPG